MHPEVPACLPLSWSAGASLPGVGPRSPSCPHPVPLVASAPLQFSLSGLVQSSLWCKEGTLYVGSPL